MKGEKVYQTALPVFTVPTKQDAEELLILVGTQQYATLPNGRPWFKLDMGFNEAGYRSWLELDDLDEVTAKLTTAWERIVERRKECQIESAA